MTPNTPRWPGRRWEFVLLAAILCLAGLLRLGWPGLTEFKRDEAHLYQLALDLAEFKAIPLRGIGSSVGLPNAPVNVYLFALPLFAWKSPLAATLFVGLLNTLSVALAYGLARRYWGARAALVSALLYAASPWAVIYSRKIWAQDLLPLFVGGYMFSGLLAFVEGKRRWLAAHLALLAVCVQIHLSGLALMPLTALLLIVFRRRVSWRAALAGAAAAALTAAPYGLYLLGQVGEMRTLSSLAGRPLEITADAISLAALVAQGTYAHSLAGPEAFRAFLVTVPNFNPLMWAGGVLTLLGLAAVVAAWLPGRRAAFTPESRRSAEAGLVVAAWLLVPVLFFIPHTTPVFPHYFIILFPAPYLLSGVFVDRVLARARTGWQRAGIWLLPLAIAGAQVWLLAGLLRFIGHNATPGAFGPPLAKLLQVARLARAAGVEDVVVVSEGTDPGVDQVPAVFSALLRGVPHRFVDGRTGAVFPDGPALVILWPGDYPARAADLYLAWGGGQWRGVVPLRAGEGEVRLAQGAAWPPVPYPRDASALLSNGAELLGSGGDGELWELWWRAPEGGPGENYHAFAHLLGADGATTAQVDQPVFPARFWREGDLAVSYFALGGQGGASVRAGMYAYPSLAPASVLDAQGLPAGEWLIFSLTSP